MDDHSNCGSWYRSFVTVISIMTAAIAMWGQVSVDAAVTTGRNAMFFEDYVVAIGYFNRAIGVKPYLAKPWLYRSIAKLCLEDYVGAENDATEAIDRNEYLSDAWEVRGIARQSLGRPKDAIEDYEHVLNLNPGKSEVMLNMALAMGDKSVERYADADSVFGVLIDRYPAMENARLGRARLYLQTGDTLKALCDLDSVLSRNSDSFDARIIRAELLVNRSRPLWNAALTDMDRAVRLRPRDANLLINRAFIRYNLDDFRGAMEDYDLAVSLDPLNSVALFNRGLLNTEVEANDRAEADFTAVLDLDDSNIRARYNRAVVRGRKHDFKGAIADINEVIKEFPDLPTGYLMRSEFERARGEMRPAARDYDRAMSLIEKVKHDTPGPSGSTTPNTQDSGAEDDQTLTIRDFENLLRVDAIASSEGPTIESSVTGVRGKVQDNRYEVQPQGPVELSFYTRTDDTSENSFFLKELDELNGTRMLNFIVFATINPPTITDEEVINKHFRSIDYYNSYLATHVGRTVDYIGRALDFISLRDYESALTDLDRAIALNPDYGPSWMLRAQCRRRLRLANSGVQNAEWKIELADLDRAIELIPNNALLLYNKGVSLTEQGDLNEALRYFDRAIALSPEFGQAFYNRGYVNLGLGHRTEGISDLSRAGELGIVSAYNLIKRIQK